MARRPFDPKRAAGGEGPTASARRERTLFAHAGEAAQLTVSQAAELIKNTLEQRIPSPLRVIGQVSNLSATNHWYFSLKDEAAVLGCVAWASTAKKFGFMPKDGDEVVATGHISHYGPQGRTQMYVSALKPVGAGALELKFRAMCDELRKLGYFEEARKKPLPAFPRRIAVITSATGAAVQDVIATAAQRCKAVGLLIVDVRVQGEGAAAEIARAIGWVDAHHARLGVDAMLVTRGGGSIEDLWAFNERIVADAAFRCSIPLVAAIGHESDTTVIELVADVRAATPTQAAMRLIPAAGELHRQVSHLQDRLGAVMRRLVGLMRERVRLIERHEAMRDPAAIVRRAAERLAVLRATLGRVMRGHLAGEQVRIQRLVGLLEPWRPVELLRRQRQALAVLNDRMRRSMSHHVRAQRLRTDGLGRQLEGVGPSQVLSRGYSMTQDSGGRLVRSVRDVKAGDAIVTHVADGRIDSIVEAAKPQGGGARKGGRKPERRVGEISQMDLFAS